MKYLPSLKQLEYLVALVETEHFGLAAERCNITPATMSAGIRDLEIVLGVAVAERTKRSVLITPIGKEIAKRAQKLLIEAEDLMTLAESQHAPMSGSLRLGAIPTIGPFMLPDILPVIEENYPNLRLLLREEQTAILLARLHAGEIDAALIALPYDTGSLTVEILFEDYFQFACNKSHPTAAIPHISEEEMIEHPLLLLEEGHCLRSHALDVCRHRRSQAQIKFEATSLQTLVQMVASGIGVTLLPQMAINAGMANLPNMKLVPLEIPASRQIGLVWRASSPHASEFSRLSEMIKQLYQSN